MIANLLFGSLFSTIGLFIFGRHLGAKGTNFIASANLFFGILFATSLVYHQLHCGQLLILPFSKLFSLSLLDVHFVFQVDLQTALMFWLICVVSFFVNIFQVAYFKGDPHLIRFTCFINGFSTAMLFLVSAENCLILFFGWEIIGIFSFLLISFWFTRIEAATSATMVFIVNKIGDLFFFQALFCIYYEFGSFDFALLPIREHTSDFNWIAFFLVCGILAKSAQFPLHFWLPISMAGPTPVSALIHTSTLVTAGIFVLLKFAVCFETGPLLNLALFLGVITAIIGGSLAIFNNDIKAIIAFSTISQLGFLLFSLGSANFNGCFAHLILHGLFKSTLFLAAGAIIHAILDQQDLRLAGALIRGWPHIFTIFFLASLTLIGFPFTGGFFSKEYLIEWAAVFNSGSGFFAFAFAIFGVLLTVIYSVGLYKHLFFFTPNYNRSTLLKLSLNLVSNFRIYWPIATLALLSIISGLPLGQILLAEFVPKPYTIFGVSFAFEIHEIHPFFVLLTFFVLAFAFLCTFWPDFPFAFPFLTFVRELHFSQIFFRNFALPFFLFAQPFFFKFIDRGFFEILFPGFFIFLRNELVRHYFQIMPKHFNENIFFIFAAILFLVFFGTHFIFFWIWLPLRFLNN